MQWKHQFAVQYTVSDNRLGRALDVYYDNNIKLVRKLCFNYSLYTDHMHIMQSNVCSDSNSLPMSTISKVVMTG